MEKIQLRSIKTTYLTYLLLQIKPVTMKTFSLKFENVSFTKLPNNILMIRHVTNKVWINLKLIKCNNFLKPLITKDIKYRKSLNFFLILIASFYPEELYSNTTSLTSFS